MKKMLIVVLIFAILTTLLNTDYWLAYALFCVVLTLFIVRVAIKTVKEHLRLDREMRGLR